MEGGQRRPDRSPVPFHSGAVSALLTSSARPHPGSWQVHTLLKGLEKIAASADIPMLVAGDFNATPGSAAHAMLVRGAVQPNNPVRGGGARDRREGGGQPCCGTERLGRRCSRVQGQCLVACRPQAA
jgi:hypothetical protein